MCQLSIRNKLNPQPRSESKADTTDSEAGASQTPLEGRLTTLDAAGLGRAGPPASLRILLVEDSPTQAVVITQHLLEALPSDQLSIIRVPNLAEARVLTLPTAASNEAEKTNLGLAGPIKFDLIILDVRLPDGIGYQFCAELKANPTTAAFIIQYLENR